MSSKYGKGWIDNPEQASAALAAIAREQTGPALFGATQAGRDAVDQDTSVLLWLAEQKIRSELKKSWDQGSIGTCVSFGWGRGANDLIMGMSARGEIDPPAEDVATEPIYGGSRVEVGGGGIRGDGSVGGWAAKWVSTRGGLLLRKKYGSYDLSKYSVDTSRKWGNSGVPDELEPIAKVNPVRNVALVTTSQGLWDAGGSGYPTAICSDQGFTQTLNEGFCSPTGTWNHCMLVRGRVLAKRKGIDVRAFPVQNSWNGYLKGEQSFIDAKTGTKIILPEGCFLCDWDTMNRILSQRDSYTMADVEGFPRREALEWLM